LNSSSYFKLVVILITLLIVWTLRDFLLLIICSLVISNIVCNLCNQIQKGLKIPRSLSLFLVLTVISVIVFTIFILVLPPFIKEFNEILVDIPNGLSKINILINTNLNKFNSLFYGEQSENVIDIFNLINNSDIEKCFFTCDEKNEKIYTNYLKNKKKFLVLNNIKDIPNEINKATKKGDCILIKGSRCWQLEKIIELIN